MISTQQKAIIRKICRIQQESFLRVANKKVKKLKKEIEDEGYVVDEADLLAHIVSEIQTWEKVEQAPEMFLRLLDETNIGLVKHHLINEFEGVEDSRPIWKQLNLFSEVNQFKN